MQHNIWWMPSGASIYPVYMVFKCVVKPSYWQHWVCGMIYSKLRCNLNATMDCASYRPEIQSWGSIVSQVDTAQQSKSQNCLYCYMTFAACYLLFYSSHIFHVERSHSNAHLKSHFLNKIGFACFPYIHTRVSSRFSHALPHPKNMLVDGLASIPSRVYSHLTPSVSGIGSGSTVTQTGIKQLLKMHE